MRRKNTVEEGANVLLRRSTSGGSAKIDGKIGNDPMAQTL